MRRFLLTWVITVLGVVGSVLGDLLVRADPPDEDPLAVVDEEVLLLGLLPAGHTDVAGRRVGGQHWTVGTVLSVHPDLHVHREHVLDGGPLGLGDHHQVRVGLRLPAERWQVDEAQVGTEERLVVDVSDVLPHRLRLPRAEPPHEAPPGEDEAAGEEKDPGGAGDGIGGCVDGC